jgi:hypothetical protein
VATPHCCGQRKTAVHCLFIFGSDYRGTLLACQPVCLQMGNRVTGSPCASRIRHGVMFCLSFPVPSF